MDYKIPELYELKRIDLLFGFGQYGTTRAIPLYYK
jgi:hypothetical protein